MQLAPDTKPVLSTGVSDKIARAFSRAAQTYDDAAGIQQHIGEDLLCMIPLNNGDWLDAGCGTGRHTVKLRDKTSGAIHALDLAEGMAAMTRRRCPDAQVCTGDIHNLPFADERFDGVFSSMMLQWSHTPGEAMSEIFRVLNRGGKAWLNIMVDGSFQELNHARRLAGLDHASNPLPDADTWRHAARQAGFLSLQESALTYTDQHNSLSGLLRSIRAAGAGTRVQSNTPASLTRADLRKLDMAYRARDAVEGKLLLSYNVCRLILEKP